MGQSQVLEVPIRPLMDRLRAHPLAGMDRLGDYCSSEQMDFREIGMSRSRLVHLNYFRTYGLVWARLKQGSEARNLRDHLSVHYTGRL